MSTPIWHTILKYFQEDTIMPKNKVQFQKGQSLPDFLAQYGTEDQCRNVLFNLRWPEGFFCPVCCHTEYSYITTRKLYQCRQCNHQVSVISGTIFDSTKLPLTKWFLAIYFVTQSKDGISSLNLARTIGISANASLRLKHKLMQTMKNRDDSVPLSGIIQMDDSYMGGRRHDGKRGRGASGKTPFVAAVSTNLEGHPEHMRLSVVAGFRSEEIRRWSAKHLDPLSIVITDGLPCFSAVEDIGCGHEALVTGGGPDSVELKEFKWINTMLGNVKNSILGTYHSVNQKHLPRYFAEFCYRFNRRFNLKNMVKRLLYAAVNTVPIPQHKLSIAELWW